MIPAGQWISWLVEAFSGQALPSSCPFSWILLHFCSVTSIAAGPQVGPELCLNWWWLLEGISGAFPRGQGQTCSSPWGWPRFPACLEVLCYIWVKQGMLSDVLATGEALQGRGWPRLSLLPSTAMECSPKAGLLKGSLPQVSLCRWVTSALVLAQPDSSCAFPREECPGRILCPGDLLCIPTLGSPWLLWQCCVTMTDLAFTAPAAVYLQWQHSQSVSLSLLFVPEINFSFLSSFFKFYFKFFWKNLWSSCLASLDSFFLKSTKTHPQLTSCVLWTWLHSMKMQLSWVWWRL